MASATGVRTEGVNEPSNSTNRQLLKIPRQLNSESMAKHYQSVEMQVLEGDTSVDCSDILSYDDT